MCNQYFGQSFNLQVHFHAMHKPAGTLPLTVR
jgi:hypothetical protein